MDDETKDDHGMIVSSSGPQVVEAVTQLVLEIQPLEQELEDEQPGEGSQLLVLESQLRDGVSFALDLVPAKLHGERPPWVGLVPRQDHCTSHEGRFSHKRSLFLEVTPGEIQQEGEKSLRRRKAWAFGRSSTQNYMQLAGVHPGTRLPQLTENRQTPLRLDP